VTNKHEGLAQAVLDGFSLSRWLPVVIGGDTLPVRKPDPQPLAEACRRLGRPLTSAVMVGDSITDADAGRNAGVPVVAVTYGYRGEMTPEELRADLLVESLEALL
jgi:phosphoglycolate phosphatase